MLDGSAPVWKWLVVVAVLAGIAMLRGWDPRETIREALSAPKTQNAPAPAEAETGAEREAVTRADGTRPYRGRGTS